MTTHRMQIFTSALYSYCAHRTTNNGSLEISYWLVCYMLGPIFRFVSDAQSTFGQMLVPAASLYAINSLLSRPHCKHKSYCILSLSAELAQATLIAAVKALSH